MSNFEHQNFILDYFSKDWSGIKKNMQMHIFFENILKINFILNRYTPLKKVFTRKLKFMINAFITPEIQKSTLVKNKPLSQFIKLKYSLLKSEAHF